MMSSLAAALRPSRYAQSLGFEPDEHQVAILDSKAERIILNTTRQFGKSTVIAQKALHRAKYLPRQLVLLLSPSQRQSRELFGKVSQFLDADPQPPKIERQTMEGVDFANGSRILSLPGTESTVRGFTADLLIVDEAARVDDGLFYSIRPMLAVSQGALILMSTPWAKRGFFYEVWSSGGDTWERHEVPATDVPRIPADFLEEERRILPETWFEREYMCRFVDESGGVFKHEHIIGAFDPELTALELGPHDFSISALDALDPNIEELDP